MQNLSRRLLPIFLLTVTVASTGCGPIERMTNYFRGNTPGRYARMMEDTDAPDNRRLGISTLVKNDFAQRPPYTDRYRQIAENDSTPLVRATAIRALNLARDVEATDLYIKALADADPLVRLEGAKALANMPSPEAIDPLLRVLNAPEEDKDIRIAAANALRYYPRTDVARALAGVLGERSFGVAWQARRSLRRITGVDYAYDDAAWLEYISNPAKPLG
jgi:hypothetical protein